MRIALLTSALALTLAGAPMAQAVSVTSVINEISAAAETAIRLLEAAFSFQSMSKGNPVQVKLSTALELIEWHRNERGEYKGQTHYVARRYFYNSNTGRQTYMTQEVVNGKGKISWQPFTTQPLEIRKYQCAKPISSDPDLKTVSIDAGFTLGAKITQMDLVSGKGDVPAQHPCTIYFEEVQLPAGCDDPIGFPQVRRLSVPLRLTGETYFILKQPGSNCSYGSVPGMVSGIHNPEAAVIQVKNPIQTQYEKNKE